VHTYENIYGREARIYRYSGGKLLQCANIPKQVGALDWILSAGVSQAGSNKLTVKAGFDSGTVGWSASAYVPYSYAKGKLARSSSTFKVLMSGGSGSYKWSGNWGTVNRFFTAYTKPGGSKVSFYAYEWDRLKVTHVRVSGGSVYFRVQNSSGKAGWYKDTYSGGYYFKEAWAAG